MRGVSIVICTYNGSRVIELALEALSRQEFAGPAEIVLVDNNSSDGVAEVAERFWTGLAHSPFPLRCIREGQPGLAFARRTGVRAAQHDIIIFCDDDNLLGPDYLLRATEALTDPTAGAAGGACVPISDREFPPFFYTYAFHYAVGSPALDAGPVNGERGWLYGAGLSARRRDLLSIYESPLFPTLTGRLGSIPGSSGDDLELCFSLRLLGYKLVYDDKLRFRHYIEARKLEKDYIKRLRDGNKNDLEIVMLYKALVGLDARRSAKEFFRKSGRLTLNMLRGHYDRFAAFWLLGFLRATPLMTSTQARIFKHYEWLLDARSKRLAQR